MDRLFLDANVLFSSAYREDAGVQRLWALGNVTLVTSEYAVNEARRNLAAADQLNRLDRLLGSMEVGPSRILDPALRGEIELRDKDWPILGGAVAAEATHLITGDLRDFGPFMGEVIFGVLILTPAQYLKSVP